MLMRIQNKSKLMDEFRSVRHQYTEPPKQDEIMSRGYSKSNRRDPYELFLVKYNNSEKYIDKLRTRDLVYYFREFAKEVGVKYTVTNIKKDMAIFKRLQQEYDIKEICGMIEFLYKSEQDYLEKDRLSPNVLASGWVNTIYADTKLWINDEYIPKSHKKAHKVTKHEWSEPINSETKSSIGEW